MEMFGSLEKLKSLLAGKQTDFIDRETVDRNGICCEKNLDFQPKSLFTRPKAL